MDADVGEVPTAAVSTRSKPTSYSITSAARCRKSNGIWKAASL